MTEKERRAERKERIRLMLKETDKYYNEKSRQQHVLETIKNWIVPFKTEAKP
jgi:hypothetical protein